MDGEEKRKQLEHDILQIIQERLQKGQMDANRAREIARMLIEKLHPPLTLEQIYEIAPTLDEHFAELTAAVLPVIQEHDQKIRSIVTEQTENLIRSGQLDQAHELLKQTLQPKES